jgi:hypothetical protein
MALERRPVEVMADRSALGKWPVEVAAESVAGGGGVRGSPGHQACVPAWPLRAMRGAGTAFFPCCGRSWCNHVVGELAFFHVAGMIDPGSWVTYGRRIRGTTGFDLETSAYETKLSRPGFFNV